MTTGRRRLLLVLGACCVLSLAAHESMQMPPVVYIGDQCRLIVRLDEGFVPAGLASGPLEVGTELPDAELRVVAMELSRHGGRDQLSIDLVAYAPGVHELPPLLLGKTLLAGLKLEVASALETESGPLDASAPASLLLVPGTSLLFYGGLVLLFLSVILLSVFAVRLPALLVAWRLKRERRRVMKELRSTLEALSEDSRDGSLLRGHLDALNERLRRVLQVWYAQDCGSWLPSEFPLRLGSLLQEEASFLADLFRFLDLVRFAPAGNAPAELIEADRRGRAVAAFLERHPEPYSRELGGGAS